MVNLFVKQDIMIAIAVTMNRLSECLVKILNDFLKVLNFDDTFVTVLTLMLFINLHCQIDCSMSEIA